MVIQVAIKNPISTLDSAVRAILHVTTYDDGSATVILHALQRIQRNLSLQARNLNTVIQLRLSLAEWRVADYTCIFLAALKGLSGIKLRHLFISAEAQVLIAYIIQLIYMK